MLRLWQGRGGRTSQSLQMDPSTKRLRETVLESTYNIFLGGYYDQNKAFSLLPSASEIENVPSLKCALQNQNKPLLALNH